MLSTAVHIDDIYFFTLLRIYDTQIKIDTLKVFSLFIGKKCRRRRQLG